MGITANASDMISHTIPSLHLSTPETTLSEDVRFTLLSPAYSRKSSCHRILGWFAAGFQPHYSSQLFNSSVNDSNSAGQDEPVPIWVYGPRSNGLKRTFPIIPRILQAGCQPPQDRCCGRQG